MKEAMDIMVADHGVKREVARDSCEAQFCALASEASGVYEYVQTNREDSPLEVWHQMTASMREIGARYIELHRLVEEYRRLLD